MKSVRHIYRLGIKDLISFRYDAVLIVLLVYCFTVMIIVPSNATGPQIRNSTAAIIDEDASPLSARIAQAVGKPYFKEPRLIDFQDIDRALDRGTYTFVVHIPSGFQRDVLAGKAPEIALHIDATAVAHARLGTAYLTSIIDDEISAFLHGSGTVSEPPVGLVVSSKYNPNREHRWFMSLVLLMHMVTMLSILLPAAALIREKERGTVEHLLVMPLLPFEISLAKVWSNSLLVLSGAMLSLVIVIKGVIGTPIIGSVPLFFLGTIVYLFATTELGVFLATIGRNMPQVGLLSMPIIVPIAMLAGGTTPIETMPAFLQATLRFSPATHYLEFITAVLLRDARIPDTLSHLCAMAAIGAVLFFGAMLRFRKTFR